MISDRINKTSHTDANEGFKAQIEAKDKSTQVEREFTLDGFVTSKSHRNWKKRTEITAEL